MLSASTFSFPEVVCNDVIPKMIILSSSIFNNVSHIDAKHWLTRGVHHIALKIMEYSLRNEGRAKYIPWTLRNIFGILISRQLKTNMTDTFKSRTTE